MPVTKKINELGTTFEASVVRHENALPMSDYVDNYVLAAGVAETVTIPAGTRFAFFSTTADFWLRASNDSPLPAAAVPSGDVTDGTGSEFNPSSRDVTGFSQFSIISEFAAKLSITWYL